MGLPVWMGMALRPGVACMGAAAEVIGKHAGPAIKANAPNILNKALRTSQPKGATTNLATNQSQLYSLR
jgi:hypothetical protein